MSYENNTKKNPTEKIKCKAYLEHVFFPKTKINSGDFAIFTARINVLDGVLPESLYMPFSNDRGVATFKGSVPELDYTQEYSIVGELINDPKYGYQYNIISMNSMISLETKEDQIKFMKYILSESQIDKLFDLTDNPIKLLEEHDIKSLTSINGIGDKTAWSLIQKYEDNKDKSSAYVKLYEYGMTKHMIDKLVSKFKSADTLVDMIYKNPYILIKYSTGIGWTKADTMARKAGMDEECEERINAFIYYYFNEQADSEGHTWVNLDQLVSEIKNIAPNIDNAKIKQYLRNAIDNNELYYQPNIRRVSLMRYRHLEENIADEMVRLINSNGIIISDEIIEDCIGLCEIENGFEYTDEQIETIKNIMANNISVVTGAAGTGKSTIMKPISKALIKSGYRCILTALSGKASLNLAEITGLSGYTIHRALGWTPDGFKYNKENKMPYDVIILDEISMVGGEIFYDLISAMKNGSKLILIGDPNQLESIGYCNLLVDIENSDSIECNKLTKIQRQAQKSGIITDSLKIKDGEQILDLKSKGVQVHGELCDMIIDITDDGEQSAARAVREFNRLYKEEKIPIEDIVICTAKRAIGSCSCKSLNTMIQKIVNPPKSDDDITVSYKDGNVNYDITYHCNDRILITQNCYDTIMSLTNEVEPVFNGNLGTILWIDKRAGLMCVRFLQGDIIIPKQLWGAIQLGYAVTCHKLQGSGIPYVIAICDPSAYTLNSKEWLYTAITRAKKYCYLAGPSRIIKQSIATSKVYQKQTWLSELLRERVTI